MCANNAFRQAFEAPRELFFSLRDLQRLVQQENSCVSVVTTKKSIRLMPLHLNNLKESIKELLKAKVNSYDVQLEGVILAHKNVKLIMNNTLLSDSRYFHAEYLADIYVFKPKVGNMLTGVVNKVTDEYVSILVHGIFNVTSFPSSGQDLPYLSMGEEVVVKVTALDYTAQIPFIKAKIVSHSNDEPDEGKVRKKKKSKKRLEDPTSLIGVSQREEQSSLIGISQRKEIVSILKNSPLRIRQSSTEMESLEAESSSTESCQARAQGDTPTAERDVEVPKKQKKKKKSKLDSDATIDGNPSKKRKRADEDGDDSMSHKKKKKKKEKHEDGEVQSSEPAEIHLNTSQMLVDHSISQADSDMTLGDDSISHKKKKKKKDKHKDIERSEPAVESRLENSAQIPTEQSIFLAPSSTPNSSAISTMKTKKNKRQQITRQIQADQSISNAPSSTLLLAPPEPKKRKLKNPGKAEHADLLDSLLKLKMEEASLVDTSLDPISAKRSKPNKTNIKPESHSSRDDSSSVDADNQASGGKKKKKKDVRDSTQDDVSRLTLADALKALKKETVFKKEV